MKAYNSPNHNIKERRGYFISPTHDFTQYTRDCEEKYWSRDTSFDWDQDVQENLRSYVSNLDQEKLNSILVMALPIILNDIGKRISLVQNDHFPISHDELNDLADCLLEKSSVLDKARDIISPLIQHDTQISLIQDKIDVLEKQLNDLQEIKMLGFYKDGLDVREPANEQERESLDAEIKSTELNLKQAKLEIDSFNSSSEYDVTILRENARLKMAELKTEFLNELRNLELIIMDFIQKNGIPEDPESKNYVIDLLLKRQTRAMKDLANHALVVEQSAIAPLTTGVIRYKRHREIQEAMTTFIYDEAKHSAVFRRFLADKLDAKEFISADLIKGANRYMWLAKISPGTGMFMANIIEAIGASYLEFFGREDVMPDQLFRDISRTISDKDERRHMDLCSAIYNELYYTGSKWQKRTNKIALKAIMKSVYGDKTEEHHLIEAFKVFGVSADKLYDHVLGCLSAQLKRIGTEIDKKELLTMIG